MGRRRAGGRYVMRDPLYTKLAEHIASLKSTEEVLWLLDQLLTEGEIHDVRDRVRILSLLASGAHSQRDVARLANVSISKVIRGASNAHSPKVRTYFRKHFPDDAD
jgi:TrpR family trp operon transcriptional repressor